MPIRALPLGVDNSINPISQTPGERLTGICGDEVWQNQHIWGKPSTPFCFEHPQWVFEAEHPSMEGTGGQAEGEGLME